MSTRSKQAAIRRGRGAPRASNKRQERALAEGKHRDKRIYGVNVGGHVCCGERSQNARKLRAGRVRPDAGVREMVGASPRTQDREGAFAADPVVVDGGALGEAAACTASDGGTRRALDREAGAACVALSLFARGRGWSGQSQSCEDACIGSGCAQLTPGLAPIDLELDAFDRAPVLAVGDDDLPGAVAPRWWPAARLRDSGHTGCGHDPGLATREAVGAIDGIHRR